MMAELLVTFSCVYNQGCVETAAQYRLYNPAPFVWAEQVSEKVSEAVFVNYWGPAALFFLNRKASVQLSSNIGLNLHKQGAELVWKVEF